MTERRPLADTLIPGFVGEPGDRTFYLQVDDAGTRSWYLLEKLQVAALAVEARELLAALDESDAGAELDVGDLAPPEAVAFRIDRVELVPEPEGGSVAITLVPTDEDAPPVVHRFSLAQLGAAARVAADAVLAGRPSCPRCGLAMDREGHACPLDNGDLRGHRP